MNTDKEADEILATLSKSGFDRDYISSILPSWWNYDVTSNKAGLSEFKLLLARNLGIEYDAISKKSPKIEFKLPHVRKLKRTKRHEDSDLSPAMALAFSAARVLVQTTKIKYSSLPSPIEIREHILTNFGAKYVSLKSLLVYAWHVGIPVLHIKNFPKTIPTMDGMVIVTNEKPAIVLANNTPYKAWLSFILAHELGHLALGHCKSGEILVDEDLGSDSFEGVDSHDDEETQANNFALELLSGKESVSDELKNISTPIDMAKFAIEIQKEKQIDAGHTILRYGYSTNNWQFAIAALKKFDKKSLASDVVDRAMEEYLDNTKISNSSFEFLQNISTKA